MRVILSARLTRVRWVALAALLLTGCPPALPVAPVPPSAGKVRMRAFTETEPVQLVAAVGDVVFIAKDHGLERWTKGEVLILSARHGLIGDRVVGLAVDPRRPVLWVATDGGVGRYEVDTGGFVELPGSPIATALGLGGDAAVMTPAALPMAAAADGGLWVGAERGLYYVGDAGWRQTEIVDPVTAVHVDGAGGLWVGTRRGLRQQRPDGAIVAIGRAQGCDVVAVESISAGPGGTVLVYGKDDGGQARLASGSDAGWWSYKGPIDAAWLGVVAVGDRAIVMTQGALYALSRSTGVLTRDSVKLQVASTVTPAQAPALRFDRLEAQPPTGATALAASGSEVLIGTRELGVARIALDVATPQAWLRRGEMLESAGTLAVHCLTADDCWLATGAPRAWRWHGNGFRPAGPPEGVVLAVTRDSAGVVYGLHRRVDRTGIEIARIDGDTWTPLGVALQTPGTRPEVSFARFAPDGLLWVGLRYHDGDEVQPWGVALVDVSLGAVAYHHASGDRRDRALGILPVPVGVLDVGFLGDQVWMASREGAVRMTGDKVEVWNEGSQLESELLSAVAVSAGGLVFVASPDGVGTYDGERWSFPPGLKENINDLALGADGRLWLATDRGIAIYDGGKLKRIDARRGLVENQVLDITIDELGRVWARGPHSLTLITP